MASPDYHYTGTVNVWTQNGIVNSGVLQAWEELQAVPAYTKRYAHIRKMTDTELSDHIAKLDQECPDLDDFTPPSDELDP